MPTEPTTPASASASPPDAPDAPTRANIHDEPRNGAQSRLARLAGILRPKQLWQSVKTNNAIAITISVAIAISIAVTINLGGISFAPIAPETEPIAPEPSSRTLLRYELNHSRQSYAVWRDNDCVDRHGRILSDSALTELLLSAPEEYRANMRWLAGNESGRQICIFNDWAYDARQSGNYGIWQVGDFAGRFAPGADKFDPAVNFNAALRVLISCKNDLNCYQGRTTNLLPTPTYDSMGAPVDEPSIAATLERPKAIDNCCQLGARCVGRAQWAKGWEAFQVIASDYRNDDAPDYQWEDMCVSAMR